MGLKWGCTDEARTTWEPHAGVNGEGLQPLRGHVHSGCAHLRWRQAGDLPGVQWVAAVLLILVRVAGRAPWRRVGRGDCAPRRLWGRAVLRVGVRQQGGGQVLVLLAVPVMAVRPILLVSLEVSGGGAFRTVTHVVVPGWGSFHAAGWAAAPWVFGCQIFLCLGKRGQVVVGISLWCP